MSEAACLLVERDPSGFLRVVFNRPEKRNAFNEEVIRGLAAALERSAADPTVRGVVLAANGPSFCAGADLNWMLQAGQAGAGGKDTLGLAQVLRALAQHPKPTVGLVQGPAFGGGVGVVSCCDIVIASTAAVFSLSEVRLGVIPSVISPFVVAAMGAREARRRFMTGERFDAHEARRIGLAHEVVEPEALAARGAAMLAEIAKGGPLAVAAAKKLVGDVAGREPDDALLADLSERIATMRAGDEAIEGFSAFLEKRAPRWVREG